MKNGCKIRIKGKQFQKIDFSKSTLKVIKFDNSGATLY